MYCGLELNALQSRTTNDVVYVLTCFFVCLLDFVGSLVFVPEGHEEG